MKIKQAIAAGVLGLAAMFTLTGCGYEKGEILEVEEDMGEHGPVLELEVAREAGLSPDSFETHVPVDSGCDKGDIYPDCKED